MTYPPPKEIAVFHQGKDFQPPLVQILDSSKIQQKRPANVDKANPNHRITYSNSKWFRFLNHRHYTPETQMSPDNRPFGKQKFIFKTTIRGGVHC